MSKAQLVESIKALQRSNPETKQAWWDYCDKDLGGIKDPNRHDEGVLETFLSWFGKPPAPSRPQQRQPLSTPRGAPPMRGGGGRVAMVPMTTMVMAPMAGAVGGPDLVGFIKTGQKQSSSFKDAWQTYCGMYGGGINDPGRHEAPFTVGFIDYLGQLAQADFGAVAAYPMPMMMGACSGGVSPWDKGPRKRSGGMMYDEPPKRKKAVGPVGGVGGDEKADLVDRVKGLQRRDPETKAAWWAFTDENHEGVHDPNRHTKETLQEFLSSYE